MDTVLQILRGMPVAGEVAVPVDAAGEAGALERLDEGLELLVGEQRGARVAGGVVDFQHVDQGEQAGVARLALGGEAGAGVHGRARDVERPLHEQVHGLADVAVEHRVGLARRLEVDDVHPLAQPAAHDLDWIQRRPLVERRVHADDAGHPVRMADGHVPDDEAAPVVADEDRLLDALVIEQRHQIGAEVLQRVALDLGRGVGQAVAALVRRDHPAAGVRHRLDLMAPGKGQLRKTVAEDQRYAFTLGTGLVVGHADAVDVCVPDGRHHGLDGGHGRSPSCFAAR